MFFVDKRNFFFCVIQLLPQAITVNNPMNSLFSFLKPLRIGLIFSALLLTGCATTKGSDSAETEAASLLAQLNQEYAYETQSDPLGAYLANRGKSDVITTYSQHQKTTLPKPQNQFANAALNYLGVKYRYGGNAPTSGFDCSGLVTYVAEKSLGLKLPRQSAEMARLGQNVHRNDLQKGDLVFFNTSGKRYSHVGIYLGDNKFVHAPRTGSVVRIESMNIAYWKKRYNGARRLASKQ